MNLDRILDIAYTVLFPVLGWFLFYLLVRLIEKCYGLSGDLLKKSINNYEDVEKYLKKLLNSSSSKQLSAHRKFILLSRTAKSCKQAERRIRLYLFDNSGNKILADSAGTLTEIAASVSSAQKAFVSKQEDQLETDLRALSSEVSSIKDTVRRVM